MRITDIRLRRVTGTFPHNGPFWEQLQSRPLDLYDPPPEPAARGGGLRRRDDGSWELTAVFCELATDEGVTGLSGPVGGEAVAFAIDRELRDLLLGEDPRASERIWDRLYRSAVHGRKGATMMAISVVDCALWDLRGRALGVPVCELLGGPVREHIPAYASMLGFSVRPEDAQARARQLVADGFGAMKWFFPHGPAQGPSGLRANLRLARSVREAVGPDVDVMLDAWMSWDGRYTRRMLSGLAELAPAWLEEPLLPDRVMELAAVRADSPVPIAAGEHEYTRWGAYQLLSAGAVDVLQPDVYWAGGISELVKICALGSTYGVPVVPHGHSVPATVQLLAAQQVATCPLLEYLVKHNQLHQFFFSRPLVPEAGTVAVPTTPGMGVELDEHRIEREDTLRWR